MGRYDLPAAFNYVLSRHETRGGKLLYVGHSMGTAMFWVAANEHPEMVEGAVELMVAMGPVAYVADMVSPIKYLSYLTDDIQVRGLGGEPSGSPWTKGTIFILQYLPCSRSPCSTRWASASSPRPTG